MKNTNHLSITIIIIIALISLTFSCSDMADELRQGIIEVDIDTTTFINGTEFEVTAIHSDSRAIIDPIVTTQFPLLIKPIIIGAWDITVKALYGGNNIGEATSQTLVEEGKKASLLLHLTNAESRLSGISFDTTPTGFSFDTETFVYENLTVENSVSLLTITPYSSSGAMINVGGHTVFSGIAPTTPIPLTAGKEMAINLRVNELGKLGKTYTFKITRNFETPNAPVLTPASGAIASGTEITMTSTGSDAIYYTTDGSTPTTSSTLYNTSNKYTYNGPGEITVKAIAVKSGADNSSVSSATYTQAESRLSGISFDTTPTGFSFDEDTFVYDNLTVENSVSSLTITPSSSSGTIRVDGSSVSSGTASSSIPLTAGTVRTINVIVNELGKLGKTYTFKITRNFETPNAPVLTPASGAIASGTEITMTSTGSDAIYYTTDGSTPTTSSTLYNTSSKYTYNGPGEITVKAIAVKSGADNSSVSSATYTQAESRLSGISFDTTPTGFSFDADTTEYEDLIVSYATSSISVTPTGSGSIFVNNTGVISGANSNPKNLQAGQVNTITVLVRETGKIPTTYTFNIKRMDISNTLSGLNITPNPGSYTFNKDTFSYNLTVPYTTASITITPSSTIGTITIDDEVINSGETSDEIQLVAEEEKTITIENKEEGKDPIIYTLNIERKGIARDLDSLIISGNPSGFTFSGDTYTYDLTVANSVEEVTLTPTGSSDSIFIDNTGVISGANSNPKRLEAGKVTTVILFTRDNGKTDRIYTFNITRMDISNTLSGLNITPNPGSYTFNKDTFSYNLTVPYTTASITITPSSTIGTITIDDEVINSGETSDEIQLVAEEEKTITIENKEEGKDPIIYTLNIERKGIARDLDSLIISGNPSGFTFSGDTYTYDLTVANSVEEVTLTPTGSSDSIFIDNTGVISGANSNPKRLEAGKVTTVILFTRDNGKTDRIYTFNITRNTLAPPMVSFNPASGALTSRTEITMTSTGSDAIYYTTDGSTPTTSSTLYNPSSKYTYNGPGEITVKAIAVKSGADNSEVSSATYSQAESRLISLTFNTTPSDFVFDPNTFSYPGLTYPNSVDSYAITSVIESGTIKFNGFETTSGISTISNPLTPGVKVLGSLRVTENGKKATYYRFDVTRNYPAPSTVSFSPASSVIAYGTEITMTSSGSDAIYYTTDGSTPTTSSTLYNPSSKYTYNGPGEITVKAIAVKSGADNSSVSSATYTQAESL